MAIGAFTSALLRRARGLAARAGCALRRARCARPRASSSAASCGCGPRSSRSSTWLLAWLVWLVLLAFPSISGGSQGLIVPERTLLGLDATPTVHFEVALVAARPHGSRRSRPCARGAPGLELSALRQAPPLATSLGVRLARRRLGAFAASARSPGSPEGSRCSSRRSPTRTATTRSSRSSCSSPCCSAARRRRSGPPSGVAALGLIGARLRPARAAAAAAARALRHRGRRAPARVRARPRRRGDRPVGDALARPPPAPTEPRARRPTGRVAAAGSAGRRVLRGRAAEGVRRGRRGRRALARAGPRRDDRADRAERLGQDDRAAPDLRRDRSPTRGRVDARRPRPDRARHRRSASSSGSRARCRRTAAFTELTALENVLVGRSVRRRYGGGIRTALATPKRAREDAACETAALQALALVGLEQRGRRRADPGADELAAAPGRARLRARHRAGRPARRRARPREPARRSSSGWPRSSSGSGRAGVALLLVEHNLRLVRLVAGPRGRARRRATVVAEGSVAEVAASGVVRQAYLGAQTPVTS